MPERITISPAEAQRLADNMKIAAELLLDAAAGLERATGGAPPGDPPNLRARVMAAVARISGRSHRPGATFREIQRALHADRATVGRQVHDLARQRLVHVGFYKPWIGRPTHVVRLAQ